MQREILFRGKRIDNEEWVDGDLYQEKFPFENKIKEVMIVEYRPDLRLVSGAADNNHYWREVIPESIGQLSPKTDKSGIRIFENDLLLVDGHRVTKVVFNEDCGSWDTMCISDSNIRMNFKALEFRQWPARCDVIGNLTDNPELLK